MKKLLALIIAAMIGLFSSVFAIGTTTVSKTVPIQVKVNKNILPASKVTNVKKDIPQKYQAVKKHHNIVKKAKKNHTK